MLPGYSVIDDMVTGKIGEGTKDSASFLFLVGLVSVDFFFFSKYCSMVILGCRLVGSLPW